MEIETDPGGAQAKACCCGHCDYRASTLRGMVRCPESREMGFCRPESHPGYGGEVLKIPCLCSLHLIHQWMLSALSLDYISAHHLSHCLSAGLVQHTITTTISCIHSTVHHSATRIVLVPAKMTCPPYGKHGLFILYRERESDFFPDLCPSTLPLLIMMFLRSFKFMATLGFCTPSSLHVGLSAPETASFLSARARLKSFSLEQISPSTLPPCLLPHGPLSHSPVFFFVVSRIINIQNPYYK